MEHPKAIFLLNRVQEITHYTFRDRGLAWEALQVAGSGVTFVDGRTIIKGNQRLAIVGNSALSSALVGDWFFGGRSKGEWDRARQNLLSNDNLANIGRYTGLDQCLNVHPMNPVRASPGLVADLVEAVFGTVFCDSGKSLDAAKELMDRLGLTVGLALVTFTTPFPIL